MDKDDVYEISGSIEPVTFGDTMYVTRARAASEMAAAERDRDDQEERERNYLHILEHGHSGYRHMEAEALAADYLNICVGDEKIENVVILEVSA